MTKGIITGDLVNSTGIAAQWRQAVIDTLNGCVSDFGRQTAAQIEMFRGDSFQIVVDDAGHALGLAIAIRASLRAATPSGCEVWDARLALGIGDVSYESGSILTSDGEAFRLSGRAFDSLGKRRLAVATPWRETDEALCLNTKFADDAISSWTQKQARVVYHELCTQKLQKELAAHLNMSPQSVNQIWNSSKCALILEYIERYKKLISQHHNP